MPTKLIHNSTFIGISCLNNRTYLHGFKEDHVDTNTHMVICGGQGWLMVNRYRYNIGTMRLKKIPNGSFIPYILKCFKPCCHAFFIKYFLESLYYPRNWISFPNLLELPSSIEFSNHSSPNSRAYPQSQRPTETPWFLVNIQMGVFKKHWNQIFYRWTFEVIQKFGQKIVRFW